MILGDVPNVTVPVAAHLEYHGYRVRQVVAGSSTRALHPERFEADFRSPVAVTELHRMLKAREDNRVGWIINLLPITPEYLAGRMVGPEAAHDCAQAIFNVCKEFEGDLRASAQEGGGRLLNVTGLDGKFGLGGGRLVGLSGAGTLGVCKTMRRECPELCVKLVDVDPETVPTVLATRMINELFTNDDPQEVGITSDGRWRIQLARDRSSPKRSSALWMDSQSVLVVTGGASGITAEVAKSLAAAAPRLIIVGRSPRPADEPDETRGLDRGALRNFLVSQARGGGRKVLPAEIEKAVDRIVKDRQIHENLHAMECAGATVEYHAVDVRDAERFGGLIDELYKRHGKIDGVIHGAGVIRDKLIREKTLESFAEVFGTKVDGSLVLAEKLRPDSLKFLVFFSSVSGRFGNAGQADYSAANEFLNKLAVRLDRQWPSRVVSINWGPWDAGMVSEPLRRMYAMHDIRLIPVLEGVRFLEDELRRSEMLAPEVVVSCSVEQIARAGVQD